MKQLTRSPRAIGSSDASPVDQVGFACSFCPAQASGWVYVPGEVEGVAVIDGVSACSSHVTWPSHWDGGMN
jgi:hypothetical protein